MPGLRDSALRLDHRWRSLRAEPMPRLLELRSVVGRRLQPHRHLAVAALRRVAAMTHGFDLLQGHDVADRRIRFCLDRNDPPIRPQIVQIAAQANRVSFRQPFALHPEKDRLGVIRAVEIAAFRIPGSQQNVPAPA